MSAQKARENALINRSLFPIQNDDINKLKLDGNIVLGDFIFNTMDEGGVIWIITNMQGWWQSPAADVPDVSRGFGDGSYDVQGRYLARDLTLNGVFLTPDPSLVEEARDRLVQAMDLVYKGAWLKTGNSPIRASWVRLSGDVSIDTVNPRGRTEFSIGLRAPDPIKYDWNEAEPDGYYLAEIPAKNITLPGTGSRTITNIGNYKVPCFIEISGPLSSPATIFNRSTEQLTVITQSLKGSVSRRVVNKQLNFNVPTLTDVATLTTVGAHGFSPGEFVFISNVGVEFDGFREIKAVPTDTTFVFDGEAASISDVVSKSLTDNVAEIETDLTHEFSVGDKIIVDSVDAVFDGEYSVIATPDSKKVRYARTRIGPSDIVSTVLVGNVATITTSREHQFIVGEEVVVSEVDLNYNGTYEIISIPSKNQFTYAVTRTNARSVNNKQMLEDVVTLTTAAPHGFIVNEGVNIRNVDLSLNGGYSILDIPSDTTFSYRRRRATQKFVGIKARKDDVVTLITLDSHDMAIGEQITVENIDSDFNGTYAINTTPTPTTLTYIKSGEDVTATLVEGGTIRAQSRVIRSARIIGGVATLVTNAIHGVIFGERITITDLGSPFNGTFTVSNIPTLNSVEFLLSQPNQEIEEVPENATVSFSGTIQSTPVSPTGSVEVAGSLPFRGANGKASVPNDIARQVSVGKAIKTNDVRFTPGLTTAIVVRDADILEIDTKNREVAFNGEVDGARGKIDILADFIELAPGENELEFEDQGSPESEALMKVYYRSGWLS